jgi:outer membrane protein OmpA-like peptidoglycan-associated protein
MKKLIGVVIAAVVLAAASAGMGYLGSLWWTSHNRLSWSVTSAGWGGAGGGAAGGPGQKAASSAASAPAASVPGAPAAGGAAATPPGQSGSPQFDGNVAAIEWGGKVESATGVAADDAEGQQNLLNIIDSDTETWWRSTADPGPKEIVLSFAGHESVLINQVKIVSYGALTPRDVEVWVATSGATEGFSRVATAALPDQAESTITFAPVEAKYLKLRLLRNTGGGEEFGLNELEVMEAQRGGYTRVLARHPALLGPHPAPAGTTVAAAEAPLACVPVNPATLLTPGHNESNRVLALFGGGARYAAVNWKNEPLRRQKYPDLAIGTRLNLTIIPQSHVTPGMLNPEGGYDTVVLDQTCPKNPVPSITNFERALPSWVANGHKLIIHDADTCAPGPNYDWLPYHLKTDNPGGQAAKGTFLRFVEENWMAHGQPARPGFIDVAAWEKDAGDYHNELGDSNTLTEWDPHWCGHMLVRNVNNVFGFVHTYARYGRGLIIYSGFDRDMTDSAGFDPDNLPCSARVGDFVVTTDTSLLAQPFQPGRSYNYPLSLLSNQGYKGTVSLSVKANPGLEGMQASFAPASVNVDGLAESKFSLTLPANAPLTPQALEVKGVDANGKTNSVCLQLVQPPPGPPSAESLKAEIDRHGRVTIYINFDFNKAIIKPESKPTVNEVLRMLKQAPDLKLSINGYTDNVGTHEYNIKLSQARAAAVVAALVKAGIAANRLSSAGFGDSNPIDDNNKPEGRAKNRRVELVKE